MSFARKRTLVEALQPDIVILPESSQKDIIETDAPFTHWVGSNIHKGLGVIGYTKHEYRIDNSYTDELPWFTPLTIADLNINVLAVWAHVKTQQLRYVRVTNDAIDHYKDFISSSPSIITGDFNSNTMWDKLHPGMSHSILVQKLRELEIESLYHNQSQESHGKETAPTQFMYRKIEKGYHIDYAFVSDSLRKDAKITIGDPEEWLQYSDHMPLIIDIS